MTELSTGAVGLAKPDQVKQHSPLYYAWRRFAANKAALGAGVVLIILILTALFAPLIAGTGGNDQAFLTSALAFPSSQHWFGIDDLGRDFFGRIVYGARVSVKSFREKEFIMAAQALGASPWHIVWRHLIPNSVSPIIVGFVLAIPLAMMLEASLSFLGIGVQPPTPSWGQMINVGMNFMFFYWHMAVFPTLALAITILATSLLGDGLRDAFDPTLKGR
jgi:ABC-type dipeptide/oligopeptide/nickel transport system permease subunit